MSDRLKRGWSQHRHIHKKYINRTESLHQRVCLLFFIILHRRPFFFILLLLSILFSLIGDHTASIETHSHARTPMQPHGGYPPTCTHIVWVCTQWMESAPTGSSIGCLLLSANESQLMSSTCVCALLYSAPSQWALPIAGCISAAWIRCCSFPWATCVRATLSLSLLVARCVSPLGAYTNTLSFSISIQFKQRSGDKQPHQLQTGSFRQQSLVMQRRPIKLARFPLPFLDPPSLLQVRFALVSITPTHSEVN